MTVSEIQRFYDYSYWANARLREPLSRLTTEEFTRTVAGSWGSVRNTLVHMMSAEGGWLERCGGPKRGPMLNPADFPTLESIVTRWSALETQMRAFLAGLTDEDLTRPMTFSLPQMDFSRAMPLGELLHHAVVHNSHHRGQVALLMRVLGHAPGNVDILFYYAETGAPV
jgi:uncharacterized damage-inducible protein DinB